MVKLDRIYTGGGDSGETSLGDGTRTPKHGPRIEACGAVDEANAAIGAARLHCDGAADDMLARIQNDLFDLGADLCVPPGGRRGAGALRIAQSQIDRLEEEIDAANAALEPLSSFVLPGGSAAAAHLHVARTAVRRAERRVAALAANEEAPAPLPLIYLNRLSDHLFVLARQCNDAGRADILWRPGGTRRAEDGPPDRE